MGQTVTCYVVIDLVMAWYVLKDPNPIDGYFALTVHEKLWNVILYIYWSLCSFRVDVTKLFVKFEVVRYGDGL